MYKSFLSGLGWGFYLQLENIFELFNILPGLVQWFFQQKTNMVSLSYANLQKIYQELLLIYICTDSSSLWKSLWFCAFFVHFTTIFVLFASAAFHTATFINSSRQYFSVFISKIHSPSIVLEMHPFSNLNCKIKVSVLHKNSQCHLFACCNIHCAYVHYITYCMIHK